MLTDAEMALDLRSSTRILIIDDEAFLRETLTAYLSDSGYQTLEAADGAAGFEVFESERPDLVVCDLRMPKMDGLAVLQKIHEISADTPVIVVSGAGVISDVVEALRLGASDYLIKPVVDLEVLEHSIDRCLERSRLREENRRYREKLEQTNRELEESLELLRMDQKAGREVQLNMLPDPDMQVGEYHFGYHIVPSLYLSGDFVDYFKLSPRHVLFYIADVSGHGASSAFVTVLLKNLSYELLRRVLTDVPAAELQPSRILYRLNEILLQVQVDKHLTAFCGIIDVESHTMRYSLGGHFPYPILKQGDEAGFLEVRGLPVGLFEDSQFEDNMIDLPVNSSIALFSDGVLEILPEESVQEKECALLDVVKDNRTDAASIADALKLSSVKDAPDDIAILTVRRQVDGI